jgi:hypothetical protein
MIRFTVFLLLLISGSSLVACGSESPGDSKTSANSTLQVRDRIVDASCGQCQFDLPGTGCDLAIVLDGNAHFVDGSHLDDHGDAHAPEGLCNAVRPAIVTGRLTDGRFQAERFEVVPDAGS